MDAGVRRRLMVVEFLRVIPEEGRVKRIADEEADLLLAWAVEGARRILKQGYFSEPASSSRALSEWVQSADPVLGWIEDRVGPNIVVVGEPPPRVSSRDAFADFRVWHLVNEGQPTRLAQRTFTERLQGSGLPGLKYIRGSNGFRGFEGLRLKSRSDEMTLAAAELARVGRL